jgi:hypothetical protein
VHQITLQPGESKIYKFDLAFVRSHVTRQAADADPRPAAFLCCVKMAGMKSAKFQVNFGTTMSNRKEKNEVGAKSTSTKGCFVM